MICTLCIIIAIYANYQECKKRKNNKPYKKKIYTIDNTENDANINYSICSICLEDFEIGDVISELKCEHYFHKKCIKQWLNVNNTCPNCRNNVYKNISPNISLIYQESII